MFSEYNDQQLSNPYFGEYHHFTHQEYNIYLVTRLDGLTLSDAKALVDRSLAAKPSKGLFLLDLDPGRDSNPGYKLINDSMRDAAKTLQTAGFTVEQYDKPEFAAADRPGRLLQLGQE